MAPDAKRTTATRTPIGRRAVTHGLKQTFLGVTKKNAASQVLAGVTLLAIAIPEQLATAQLAGVAAFAALIAFITATLVFTFAGSNPILSVGADSTIAPLFAVALLKIALPNSPQYYSLVAATALVTGLLLVIIGVVRLGWLADFLSVPIVAGFLSGIGVIIIVHQLPRVFGVNSSGDSVVQRINSLAHHLGHVNGWSIAISLGTLSVMMIGEKVNARLPWALAAVVVSTVLAVTLSLARHGVELLGTVVVGGPTWRWRSFSTHEWSVVVTTALTLVIVIMSQSAATARSSADEIGVADNLSRDFLGIGLANVATGLVGAFAVNASPARTTISRLAGGRTKLVGLVAALGALFLSPLATYARNIPLACLAGILLFVAGRLIKIAQIRGVYRISRSECILAIVATLGVVFMGVEIGLAIAVGLAILEQTWRSARPRMLVLGRRGDTTSWEPLEVKGVEMVDHILALLFQRDLFFANSGVFRRELYKYVTKYPQTRHIILDAVAIADVDYTSLLMLGAISGDLAKDKVSFTFARANDAVKERIHSSGVKNLELIHFHNSVDAAARHSLSEAND
jgi:MFS superfamily sulfate permease-like transporter